jgi:hypothetical protein
MKVLLIVIETKQLHNIKSIFNKIDLLISQENKTLQKLAYMTSDALIPQLYKNMQAKLIDETSQPGLLFSSNHTTEALYVCADIKIISSLNTLLSDKNLLFTKN